VPYLLPTLGAFFVHVSGPSDDLIRASGTFSNPNYMAGSAAIALTVAMSLLPGIRSRAMQGVTLASAIVLGSAILISLSRGGLITAVVGLLAVGLTRGRRTAVVVLVVGLAAALVIYPAFVEWRLTNLTGSASVAAFRATSDSDASRLDGALAGVALFFTSPIFGVGFGHYLEAAAQIPGTQVAVAAHNWYTYVIGEQGAAGAILWLLLLGFLIANLIRRPAWPRSVGLSVAAALLAAGVFLEVPTSFQTFAIPAIVLAAAIVGRWPRPTIAAGPALHPVGAYDAAAGG
jgi:O-antigen ligase